MQKNTRLTLWTALGAVAVIIFAIFRFMPAETASEGNAAAAGPGALAVEAVVVAKGPIRQIVRTTGSLLPDEQVTLFSETAGKITRIYFREGRPVANGKLLVKINDAELQARLRKALQEKELAADREFRMRRQFEDALISEEAYEVSLNTLKTLEADVELVRAQIAKTEVYAPFAGKVGLRYVSKGSFINTSTPIANLLNVDSMKVEFAIPEKYAGQVRRGHNIRFTVEGVEQPRSARVYAVEPRLDAATRTLSIRAITANPDGKLFAGSFARIELVVDERDDAIMIPTEALIPELGGQKVYRLDKKLAEAVAVETGLRTETQIQITSGLQPGDTVITSGIMQLRSGIPVQIYNIRTE